MVGWVPARLGWGSLSLSPPPIAAPCPTLGMGRQGGWLMGGAGKHPARPRAKGLQGPQHGGEVPYARNEGWGGNVHRPIRLCPHGGTTAIAAITSTTAAAAAAAHAATTVSPSASAHP